MSSVVNIARMWPTYCGRDANECRLVFLLPDLAIFSVFDTEFPLARKTFPIFTKQENGYKLLDKLDDRR
jgi:hypothetical protein